MTSRLVTAEKKGQKNLNTRLINSYSVLVLSFVTISICRRFPKKTLTIELIRGLFNF